MNRIDAAKAKKELYNILNQVNNLHEPIEIVNGSAQAVLIGAEDWRHIQETLYLMSIPGMRDSIIEGLNTPVDDLLPDPGW